MSLTLYEIYVAVCKASFVPVLNHTQHHQGVWGSRGVKVKVSFTLEQATKAQRGSRGIAQLFP
jgi:hypothetical protein